MSDINKERLEGYKAEAVKAVDMAYQAGSIDQLEYIRDERKQIIEWLRKALSEGCAMCDDYNSVLTLPPCDRELGKCYFHEVYKYLRETKGEVKG